MLVVLISIAATASCSREESRAEEGRTDVYRPLSSPDGTMLLTVPIVEDSGGRFWRVTISDSEGAVLYEDTTSRFTGALMVYRAWDPENRAWLYNSDDGLVHFYSAGPEGWAHTVYGSPGAPCGPGLPGPPPELFPGYVDPPAAIDAAMLPETLLAFSGPGWAFSLACPGMPESLSFLRDTVITDMEGIRRDFALWAEQDHASWGGGPGFMSWTFEAVMSLPPSPAGIRSASCVWWEFSGGAHGNTGYRLYRFAHDGDPGDGSGWVPIGTRDLLADSAELVVLSELVADSLVSLLGDDADMQWILDGAGPEWANYDLLLPVPDSTGVLCGFSVHFPAYSVAPYVAGPQDVYIPLDLLRR